jgi:hypothetical protein
MNQLKMDLQITINTLAAVAGPSGAGKVEGRSWKIEYPGLPRLRGFEILPQAAADAHRIRQGCLNVGLHL